MPKLFVSLPMSARREIDIRNEMNALKILMEMETGENFELIDTLDTEEEPNDILNTCWYLGQSISKLATADLVVFSPHWTMATGCIIEHMVCAFYDIPYVDVHMDDFAAFEDYDIDDEDEDDDYDDYVVDTVGEEPTEIDIPKEEPEKPATETE